MTRRRFPIAFAIASLSLAPIPATLAAQVGYTPAESPYEDLRGRQAVTLAIGALGTGGDPAGVGPRSGMQFNVRYELLLTGPLWLQARTYYAPSLDRTVKDPLITGPARIIGTSTRPLFGIESGFGLNLTGNKSWHRLTPQLHGAIGWVTGGTQRFDEGGYRFGNKFTVSYGMGLRVVTGRAWELHADVTHLFWKYTYPEDYGRGGVMGDNAIVQEGSLAPWKGNAQLSFGMTRFFHR